jgi:hypothetical protein
MLKKLAAFGLTAALGLSPMAAFAQAAAPDTTAPAADANPGPEKPMKAKHKKPKKHHTAKKQETTPPAEAPKT